MNLDDLDADVLAFLAERHLAALTVVRADGTPHVTPVGFSYDPDLRVARIITFAAAHKVRHVGEGTAAAVSQVDGPRWLTLEGRAIVTDDAERVAAAVAGFAGRYREPKQRPDRVAIELQVEAIMGRA
jgi:PPOX class probable F420-dependent enzyme